MIDVQERGGLLPRTCIWREENAEELNRGIRL